MRLRTDFIGQRAMNLNSGNKPRIPTIFDDPRRGIDRRGRLYKTIERDDERRAKVSDRRSYMRANAEGDWWLKRNYVDYEKTTFVGKP